MKKLLFILFLLVGLTANSQCVSNESHVISPGGSYSPGQTVTVWYTLGTFTGININWIHAFQINLGVGWTNLTPTNTPSNVGGSVGNWLWQTDPHARNHLPTDRPTTPPSRTRASTHQLKVMAALGPKCRSEVESAMMDQTGMSQECKVR